MLNPLRFKLLTRLDETIRNHHPETWFDCYLSIYILLNHIEWASAHGNEFSRAHELGVSSDPPALPSSLCTIIQQSETTDINIIATVF